MDNPLMLFPGYLLRRASAARILELSRRLKPLRLTPSEASALFMVGRNPGLSQTAVGRLLAIQRANINPMVRRLMDRDLLDQRPEDGRRQALYLTEKGQDLVAELARIFAAHEASLMEQVPAHLRDEVVPLLLALWGKAGAGMEDEDDPTEG